MDEKKLMLLQSDLLYDFKEKLEKKYYSLTKCNIILDGSCGSTLGEAYVYVMIKGRNAKMEKKFTGELLDNSDELEKSVDLVVTDFVAKNQDLPFS